MKKDKQRQYSDAELLDYLKEMADRLGHSPAQKEIDPELRLVIKQRFGKWPYALQRAGLSKSAGKDGISVERMDEDRRRFEEVMARIRGLTKELGRLPEMNELGDVIPYLKTRFTTWAEVLKASGVDREWSHEESVEKIAPYSGVYLKDYGKQSAKRASEELFKASNHDEATRHQLGVIRRTAKRLGRSPLKNEVPSGTYGELLKKFGSWRNILYQIDMEPLGKNETAEIRRKQREQKKRELKTKTITKP
ncbi:MAG: hypothetical protein IJ994_04310 [Firmicutes bacterium]|nr:hypothetical protein [Bacillota bacterium]